MNIKIVLITSIWLFLLSNSLSALTDSVGVIKVKGYDYILHKVEKGQGLYSVAKRYDISVDDIKKANGDTLETLQLDQVIFVPKTKIIKEKTEFIHKVDKGETLYRIAVTNHVKVEDIIKWNKLEGTSIKPGDELKLYKFNKKTVVEKDYSAEGEKTATKEEKPKINYNNDIKPSNPNEVIEEGIASFVNDPSFQSKMSLALHKTAPNGTVIKVVNLINNKSTFVKVVGKLPEDSKELIKISKFSAKQIGLLDKYSRVKLFYDKIPQE